MRSGADGWPSRVTNEARRRECGHWYPSADIPAIVEGHAAEETEEET